jgi:hypothetical protein
MAVTAAYMRENQALFNGVHITLAQVIQVPNLEFDIPIIRLDFYNLEFFKAYVEALNYPAPVVDYICARILANKDQYELEQWQSHVKQATLLLIQIAELKHIIDLIQPDSMQAFVMHQPMNLIYEELKQAARELLSRDEDSEENVFTIETLKLLTETAKKLGTVYLNPLNQENKVQLKELTENMRKEPITVTHIAVMTSMLLATLGLAIALVTASVPVVIPLVLLLTSALACKLTMLTEQTFDYWYDANNKHTFFARSSDKKNLVPIVSAIDNIKMLQP